MTDRQGSQPLRPAYRAHARKQGTGRSGASTGGGHHLQGWPAGIGGATLMRVILSCSAIYSQIRDFPEGGRKSGNGDVGFVKSGRMLGQGA